MRRYIPTCLSHSQGVLTKLEPLSEEHVFLKFLRNVDNTKTLSGFFQELSDAITYYQV